MVPSRSSQDTLGDNPATLAAPEAELAVVIVAVVVTSGEKTRLARSVPDRETHRNERLQVVPDSRAIDINSE